MQALSKPKTSPPPDSAPTELIVRKWLVVFGSLFNREITPLLVATWCELLGHLTPEQAESGLKQIADSWTFSHFPTPGAVLAQFEKAEEKGFELEAEMQWQNFLAWVCENVYPDTGIRRGAAKLPAAVEHAARAAGGIFFIQRCSEDQLVWCRKTFLAAYKNIHETGQVAHLLGDGDAKQIVRKLNAGPPSLPSANPDWEKKYSPPATPQSSLKSAILNDSPKPYRVLTQEEWDQRKQRQKAAVEEWLRTHPEHAPKSQSA
jgi:hypothetical protein